MPTTDRKNKAVALWLLTGVFMIVVEVILGGTTRLTGSGLSITEWNPIMGAVPPLNEQEWKKAFESYQQIAQYKYLNSHFSLSDFKAIFFWEWFHRLWARLIGIVFLAGFIYFIIRRYFNKDMVIPFIILFGLGALQGLIGWIMVKSGLNETDLYVNHIKLSIHFISALTLLCYTLWFALKLLVPEEQRVSNKKLNNFTIITITLLGIQLIYGAFMSGLKAAPYAPTWPTVNGDWIPEGITSKSWINDHINVQFIHRQMAYLLATIIIFWMGAASKAAHNNNSRIFKKTYWLPLLIVLIQVTLGIITVLHAPTMGTSYFGVYELLAESHQLVAMLLLISLIINLYLIKRKRSAA